jgi:hypothetical protein
MLLMDLENLHAPGWSHVISTTNDLAELEAFRIRVGAPPRALHLRNPCRPHLDLRREPRERALMSPEVRVFQRSVEMLRHLHRLRAAAAVLLDQESSELASATTSLQIDRAPAGTGAC